jgi:hypothetical protein
MKSKINICACGKSKVRVKGLCFNCYQKKRYHANKKKSDRSFRKTKFDFQKIYDLITEGLTVRETLMILNYSESIFYNSIDEYQKQYVRIAKALGNNPIMCINKINSGISAHL